MRLSASLACGMLCAATLCSGAVFAAAGSTRGANSIMIYDPADLSLGRYQIVQRLWVESWRSAFDVPRHADAGAAVAELKTAAARLGADGLINVVCVPDPGWRQQGSSIFCHALAIRLKK